MSTARELLERIYARPDDDALRRAYADALLKDGDPRGELIDLQLRGENPARCAELVKANAHRWLGPLKRLLNDVEFERGFPARARVGFSDEIARALLEPVASTIREIAFEGMTLSGVGPLLSTYKTTLAPRTVHIGLWDLHPDHPAIWLKEKQLPALRSLAVASSKGTHYVPRDFKKLLGTRGAENITALTCTAQMGFGPWLDLLKKTPHLATITLHHGEKAGVWNEVLFRSAISRVGDKFAIAITSTSPQKIGPLADAFERDLADSVVSLSLPPDTRDGSGSRALEALANALRTAGFEEHAKQFDAAWQKRAEEEARTQRRNNEHWAAVTATENDRRERHATRPRVRRFPIISVRDAAGATTEHQALELAVGTYTLRWISELLFVRRPHGGWEPFEGGSLGTAHVSVEDVTMVVDGPTPDEATDADWKRWLDGTADMITWSVTGLVERAAAERAATLVRGAADTLRVAHATPRATARWLAKLDFLSERERAHDRLDACVSSEGWVSSHETGTVTHDYGFVELGNLPADKAIVWQVTKTLREAAELMLARPLRACSECRTVKPALHMHDRTTCHGCANRKYGVVY